MFLLVAPGLSCGMQTLRCSRWDLGPQPGTECPPALGAQSLRCWTTRGVASPVTLTPPCSLRESEVHGVQRRRDGSGLWLRREESFYRKAGGTLSPLSPRRQGDGEEGLPQGEACEAISGGPRATSAVPSPQKPGPRRSPSLLFLNQPSLSTLSQPIVLPPGSRPNSSPTRGKSEQTEISVQRTALLAAGTAETPREQGSRFSALISLPSSVRPWQSGSNNTAVPA